MANGLTADSGLVDSRGNLIADPTLNVVSLVAEATKRQDDLRQAETYRLDREATLREDYGEKLRKAEASRIDAIRAVDVGAVNRAAEVSAQQADTLAKQVALSAEALRSQVEQARQQTATALAAALEPIQKDIQELRRTQYEQQGAKASQVEGRDTKTDTRTLIFSVLGVLATIAFVISPHIH
jgi:hypothetical protein